ncbi:hypothetical protein HMPREF9964_1654 [Streptococcus dysgalactiae subsp. equisimilis SK1249]|nr:hypothetical protein HMPREF9964_1654 [Streptococcus dysgalactiae subsp. equisimilis SK1249]EGR89254.1 hypothetical protein HMPREF9963_0917 [Streptococcus dysgalactiae subsp. equisimilis SK1250]SDV97689.1 hypothetical protein ISR2_1212 [Streptococcus pyogenes]
MLAFLENDWKDYNSLALIDLKNRPNTNLGRFLLFCKGFIVPF